jgi:hypothetical protein
VLAAHQPPQRDVEQCGQGCCGRILVVHEDSGVVFVVQVVVVEEPVDADEPSARLARTLEFGALGHGGRQEVSSVGDADDPLFEYAADGFAATADIFNQEVDPEAFTQLAEQAGVAVRGTFEQALVSVVVILIHPARFHCVVLWPGRRGTTCEGPKRGWKRISSRSSHAVP